MKGASVLALVALSQLNCAMLFFRPAALPPELSWIEGDSFAETIISYEEKNPFDPLAGTTLKRNYKCLVRQVTLPDRKVRAAWSYNGWCLPEATYIWSAGVMILAGTSDVYGDANRRLLLIKNKGALLLARSEANRAIQSVAPAPDRSSIFALEEGNSGQQAYFIRISGDSISRISAAIPGSIVEWIWRKNSSGVLARLNDGRVLALSAENGKAENAKTAPQAYLPRTLGGGAINAAGISYYFDEQAGAYRAEAGLVDRTYRAIAPE